MKRNSDGSIYEELAKRFLAHPDQSMSDEVIAKYIATKTGTRCTQDKLYNHICQVRKVLEEQHKCSLYRVQHHGYRIATVPEVTRFGARRVHYTVALAARCNRLFPLVDKKQFLIEFKSMYNEAEEGVLEAYNQGSRLLKHWKHTPMMKGDENGD